MSDLAGKSDNSKKKPNVHLSHLVNHETYSSPKNLYHHVKDHRSSSGFLPDNLLKKRIILVFKVDSLVLTYVCLSYFLRYLDASNVNVANASVSGMKEDLKKITGAQYVYLTQLFNAAYCASGFFSTVLFTKFKFSKLFPFLEIAWGIFTIFIFKAKDFKTVACLRFFQGLCEGTAWPAIHFLLGSWYTSKEPGKRASIYTSVGVAGNLLSGIISAALVKTMDGKHSLKGWQWLFIIDGVTTIPIACLGLIIPSTPEQMVHDKFFSEEECSLAVERTKINGKKRHNKFDWSIVKRCTTSYQNYVFIIAWTLWNMASQLYSYMGVALKALKYNVYDRNNIPTAISGFGIFPCLTTGFLVDLRGGRIECLLAVELLFVAGTFILKIYDVPRTALFFGYFTQDSFAATSPMIAGWCNLLTMHDTQLGAMTIGSLNFFNGLTTIPFVIELFNTDYTPRNARASTATIVVAILLWLMPETFFF